MGPVSYLTTLTGYQNLTARVFGVCALLNIMLNIVLIPHWGMVGAAITTTATTTVWNVWLYLLVKKHLGIRSFVYATT
jgi:O-antigen/teichoic acid export membrane protein